MYVTGYILQVTQSWDLVFITTAGVTLFGMVFYLLFASGENSLTKLDIALKLKERPLGRAKACRIKIRQNASTRAKRRLRSAGLIHYVLFVLVIVYVFNFIDRNILSILSQDIQADLGLPTRMGFLYGTVFAVFYAVFGIPLARFADVWVRRSLISLGFGVLECYDSTVWLCSVFPCTGAYRIGVGIGEASASPAAYSMLSAYYPQRLRATVIAIYSSGVYIGGGIGLFLGGFIMESWNSTFPDPDCTVTISKGWHAAFLGCGYSRYLHGAVGALVA